LKEKIEMRFLALIYFLIVALFSTAQQSTGTTIIGNAMHLLGKPYISHSLENPKEEKLLLPTEGFDCYTFVERVLAMSTNPQDLVKSTLYLRYRNATINGYCSRLHYLSDWLSTHIADGTLIDVTPSLPFAKELRFDLNFISSHPALYPGMLRDACTNEIQQIERKIAANTFYYIPKKRVRALEATIQHGDIIAITTNKKGLDYSHVGFAYKKNGKLYLMHASTTEKKVVISQHTLSAYLMRYAHQTGISVLRWNKK
jgi:hypothetical protein